MPKSGPFGQSTKTLLAVLAINFGTVTAGALVAAATETAQHNNNEAHPVGDRKGTTQALSVKCDTDAIPNISKKRLAGCKSATWFQQSGESVTESVVLFHIDPKDKKISDGNRAELRDLYEAVNGEEIWYRISTKLPSDFPIDAKHRLVLSQWHERTAEGAPSLRPPLSHRLWNGRFVVTLWNQDRIDRQGLEGDGEILFEIPKIELGVYYDFVYKAVWSPDDTGQIIGWMRKCSDSGDACEKTPWQEIVRHEGPSGYPGVIGYYFKYGLYTVREFDTAFTAYHKDYQAGANAEAIGATDPIFLE